MNENKMIFDENVNNSQHPDYRSEIVGIICSNMTPKLMKKHILDYHEYDIASALGLLKKDQRMRLYSILDSETLSGILEYSDMLRDYISEVNIKKRAEILSYLEISTVTSYLSQVTKEERSILIDLMPEDIKGEISLLDSFDEDEIGSRMSTNYISVPHNASVRQAMKMLVEQAADNDNISTIYIVDDDESLMGAIDLKDLIVARESTPLDSIITTSYPYVYGSEIIEECIERIKEYSEDSIPVLDNKGRLKGVLTAQDLTELVEDELGDDYAKLAGLAAEEDLHEPLKTSIKKRLPWLIVLLFLGLLVSGVVGIFESVVSHLAVIVCFQSLVLGMAGNVGTQSLAVTIRVLTDDQIASKNKLYLVAKEVRIGLINGLIMGLLSFVFIGGYLHLIKGEPAVFSFSVSLCTGAALLIAMLLSSFAGTVIPIIFKRLKIDPAAASGPLITTVNDLVAVVAYYGLAWFLLINILNL